MGCMLLIEDYVMVFLFSAALLSCTAPNAITAQDAGLLMLLSVSLLISVEMRDVTNKDNDLLALHGLVLPAACSSPPQALLSPSSFYSSFQETLRLASHSLSICSHFANLPLSPSLPLSLSPTSSTLMSFRCIRIGLRLQQPFSAGSILPPPLPPSLSPSPSTCPVPAHPH